MTAADDAPHGRAAASPHTRQLQRLVRQQGRRTPEATARRAEALPWPDRPAPRPHVPAIRGIPGPFRLYFVSFDCNEPPHVHVQRDRATAKFWLDPLTLAANHGLGPRDLSLARRVIFEHRPRIVEAWREHCDTTGE